MNQFALQRRTARFASPDSGRGVVLALSHGLLAGPLPGIEGVQARRDLISTAVDAGVTGLILSTGQLREAGDLLTGPQAPGLFVTSGWTSLWRTDQASAIAHDYSRGAYRNILDPETVLAMGADVAHVYLLLGDDDPEREANEVERIARYIERSHQVGLPVLVEGLVRGPHVIGAEQQAGHVATVARMATEAGADMLKLQYPGSADALARIVQDVAVPVIVLGGAKRDFGEILEQARGVVEAGALGVVYGRNIFQADDPADALRRIIETVLG